MKSIWVRASWSGPARLQKVPCGKCGFCLEKKRSEWIFRIGQEIRYQQNKGYFLTITYDEKHVRRTFRHKLLSLRFKDIQLYLKRLRKAKYYCKYVCVGEYGTKTERPHYHMLIWTDAPPKFLAENWKSSRTKKPMGIVHFGDLNLKSAMYAMKYIIQPKVVYKGREKVRAQFSKGLGLSYLSSRMYDRLTQDYENPEFFTYVDGNKVAIPKYYKDKIFTRWQRREQSLKYIEERQKEYEKELEKIRIQGVENPKAYYKALRVERSKRILEKSKVNQLL